jgi:hypothetical protein
MALFDVRFTPKSRHRLSAFECPLYAKRQHRPIKALQPTGDVDYEIWRAIFGKSSFRWLWLEREVVRQCANRTARSAEPWIEGGKDQQREQGCADQATDNDRGERALHFGARVGRNRHGQEAETGYGRRHKYGP